MVAFRRVPEIYLEGGTNALGVVVDKRRPAREWTSPTHCWPTLPDVALLFRTRLDPPTGMLAGALLKRVRNGVEDGVEANLVNAKQNVEATHR